MERDVFCSLTRNILCACECVFGVYSKWARLADQQATEIHLALPSQTWDYKFTLIWPFTHGFWG